MSRSRKLLVGGSIAALVVLGAVALLYAVRPVLVTGAEAPALPPLPRARASCPEGRDHAAHAAHTALKIAGARMQRYAFAPSEGRMALAQLAIAVECSQVAGDAQLAALASRREAELRARIEGEAGDRLRRYEALKQHQRLREAAEDIAFLIELGWPEHGALADALRRDRDALESTL